MKTFVLLFAALFFTLSSQAQSIQEQFETFRQKSNTWEDYKVIKIDALSDFWGVVSDTLTLNQRDLSNANARIKTLSARIDSLESSIASTQKELSKSESVNSSISFLGLDINKTVYNIIVWCLIAGLCLAVGTIYMMYKTVNKVTRQTRHDHKALEQEYTDYKDKAVKKQMTLKRELQTALNTLEENRIKVSNKLGYNKGPGS